MSGISVDSNILSAIWNGEDTAPALSVRLGQIAQQSPLILSGLVYAELYAEFGDISADIRDFTLMPEMPLTAWIRAGQAHAAYTLRRKKSGGGVPRQILTDYLIGAHASVHGLSIFTLNTRDYVDFPEVKLLTL